MSELAKLRLQREANAGKPGFDEVPKIDSLTSASASSSTAPQQPHSTGHRVSGALESISEDTSQYHRNRSSAAYSPDRRPSPPRTYDTSIGKSAYVSPLRKPVSRPQSRQQPLSPSTIKSQSQTTGDPGTSYTRLSHVDLLQRIEDELMQETPLEFATGSSRTGSKRGSDDSGSSEGDMAKATRQMPRSVSEPIDVNRLTINASSVQRRSDAPLLSAIINRDEEAMTSPREVRGDESQSLAEDMESLLREVRNFRGRVASIRSTVGTFPPDQQSPATTEGDTQGNTATAHALQLSSAPDFSRSHTVRASTATLMTDYGRLSQFSLHSPNAENVFAAYGGQQPSSIYITPSQAQRIAQELGDDQVMLAPPPPIDPDDAEKYEELQTDFISQQGARAKTVSKAKYPLSDFEDRLHVVKQRSSSSFSNRPDTKPRGPRAISTGSMAYTAVTSPETSSDEKNGNLRPLTPTSLINRTRVDSDERKSFVTAESSIQSESDDYGNDENEEPPELPRRNSGRARSKIRSISFDASLPQVASSSSGGKMHTQRHVPAHRHSPAAQRHRHRHAGELHQRSVSEGGANISSSGRNRRSAQKADASKEHSSPIRERKSSHSSIYTQPRDPATTPSWLQNQDTDNLDWLGKGAEFDELINLEMEHKRMLEKFIETLGRLSVDVAMDEKKRDEGRRRMDNALLALEGWI
ncbi:uncharacterized protein V2V93DRAFT_370198 [Kockiozyma suomiensis]|uniref:uncharacterized protein n=1 Tax=Kockiozyma suomiensis TaxID=1337062 RepID=UPI003343FBFC